MSLHIVAYGGQKTIEETYRRLSAHPETLQGPFSNMELSKLYEIKFFEKYSFYWVLLYNPDVGIVSEPVPAHIFAQREPT